MNDNPTIAVLGAGVMGTGISTLIAGQGFPVVLVDVEEAALTRARGEIGVGMRHPLHARLREERCRPAELLLEKVRKGELGRKTGRGFCDYREAAE
jgi:methoxymalonate biosynthesis protein